MTVNGGELVARALAREGRTRPSAFTGPRGPDIPALLRRGDSDPRPQ